MTIIIIIIIIMALVLNNSGCPFQFKVSVINEHPVTYDNPSPLYMMKRIG
jgi:hypothetical protein